jgi:hypothetical protein
MILLLLGRLGFFFGNKIRRYSYPAMDRIDAAAEREVEKWYDIFRFPGPCLLMSCALQVASTQGMYYSPERLTVSMKDLPVSEVHHLSIWKPLD